MPDSITTSRSGDDPDKSPSLVQVLAQNKPATKSQKDFQKLVAKIERKREQLQQWQAYGPRYSQRLAAEVEPLEAQLRVGQRQLALLIDRILSQPATGRPLGRIHRLKLEQILMTLLTNLLEDGEDTELEALHDRYSEVSHAQIRQSGLQETQAMLEDVFGLDMGDAHGAASVEELLQHAQRKVADLNEEEAARVNDRINRRPSAHSRARSAKAEADAARRERAAQDVSQSLREVYRKLVGSLHPDRELDPEEKQRKTLLMQRVNHAYDARDLLTLLQLQIEIEQIDAAHLSSVPPQRLSHYLQILREQLADLERELEHCVLPYRHFIGWAAPTLPIVVDHYLNADIAQLRAAIQALQADLQDFRDPTRLRAALRSYELEQGPDDDEPLLGFIDRFEPPKSSPRGKKRRRR